MNLNLQTSYMGLSLNSPLVVSACPLSEKVENIAKMEDMGAGAVVLFSLFEEQLRKENELDEQIFASTADIFPEAASYFPDLDEYRVGTEKYLEIIRKAKERVDIPIIASLNGITDEGWIDYSKQMEQAGADALEINIFYIPADIELSALAVENRYIDIVKKVRNTVDLPIAVKLNPYFSSMGNMALKLEKAGANALVLFNRFYQPDFDVTRLEVLSNLEYSHANELRLPLLWISLLYGKLQASLAATTGVQGALEVIKYLLAGADVAMTASALYKHGIKALHSMKHDLMVWMEQMGFKSIDDFKGIMSQQKVADPTAFERANYIRILETSG
ncbi:MAG: dihydroorotate dehydrogenase-like protein [Bacteroidetes bacterium]|nr:MAG: dihydroorotate dehydrogenase-like protein [Bacteroidota bacterium]